MRSTLVHWNKLCTIVSESIVFATISNRRRIANYFKRAENKHNPIINQSPWTHQLHSSESVSTFQEIRYLLLKMRIPQFVLFSLYLAHLWMIAHWPFDTDSKISFSAASDWCGSVVQSCEVSWFRWQTPGYWWQRLTAPAPGEFYKDEITADGHQLNSAPGEGGHIFT